MSVNDPSFMKLRIVATMWPAWALTLWNTRKWLD